MTQSIRKKKTHARATTMPTSAAMPATTPAYLAVARSGNTYTAYTSSNGTNWTPVVGSSVTMNTKGPMLAGLAVTSHDSSALSTATFTGVRVSTAIP